MKLRRVTTENHTSLKSKTTNPKRGKYYYTIFIVVYLPKEEQIGDITEPNGFHSTSYDKYDFTCYKHLRIMELFDN